MEKSYSALLVEDELQILNGMKEVLPSGIPEIHEVYTAVNGSMALEVLREHSPDFVITDICMPVMDGVEFVHQMRLEGFEQPVLVLTALEDFKTAQALIPSRIEKYLVKPFSVKDIIEETLRIIQKLRQIDELDTTCPEIVQDADIPVENSAIREIQVYINSHLADKITLQSLADTLHISRTYLSALFKRETGITLNEYITKQRIKEAKRLLSETDFRIGEICERVGFQSDKYFIQVFRSREGTTPLVFRQNLRRRLDWSE